MEFTDIVERSKKEGYNGELGAEVVKEALDSFEKKAKKRLYGK